MYDADKLAALTDAQLKSLDANVKRLGVSGTVIQQVEAGRLTPMIAHEQKSADRGQTNPGLQKKGGQEGGPRRVDAAPQPVIELGQVNRTPADDEGGAASALLRAAIVA